MKIFKPLINRTVKVYIDDIVVKSKTQVEHIQHLEETLSYATIQHEAQSD